MIQIFGLASQVQQYYHIMEENQDINGDFFEYEDPIIASYNDLCEGYKSAYVCTNELCSSNAFICDNIKCNCINILHSKCGTKTALDLFLHRLRKQKKEIPNHIRQMFSQVIKNYDLLIEKISEDKLQFIEYVSMFGLSKQSIKALKLINEGRAQQISGQLVYPIYYGKISKEQKNQSYFPEQMSHSNEIRDTLSQIGLIFNKIAFQLISSTGAKNQLAVKKFDINDIIVTEIKSEKKLNWDFIPTEISVFRNVKRVSLNAQNIRKIRNLDQLFQIQELFLNDNNLSKIQNLSSLTNLRFLQLKNNFIVQIAGLETLIKLQMLNLEKNQIIKFENLSNLQNLKLLRLNYNKIKKIQNLEKLTALQSLYLNHNQIQRLQNLDQLPHLQVLNLQFNKIKKFQNLEKLQNLHYLNLGNNPVQITRQSMKKVDQAKKKGIIVFIT